jgi:UPF0042 nucleotide-binding protein
MNRTMPNDETGTHVVIITGLSGAGRSQTSNILEDIGYFVVDNLPTVLISDLVATAGPAEGDRPRIAVVTDTRTGVDETDLDLALIDLHRDGIRTTVLFLDADDEVLARRFEETRRPHPADGTSLGNAIANERVAFEPVRAMADVVVDTSDLNVHQLKEKIRDVFSGVEAVPSMRVDVSSFGFKRGTPRVVDIMFDVRFLPNPHWEPELRPQTGLDAPVREYVFKHYEAGEFLTRTTDMLDFLLPYYEAEGKSYLTIAVGCTGGRHRSVALAEALAAHLRESGVDTSLNHRDIDL